MAACPRAYAAAMCAETSRPARGSALPATSKGRRCSGEQATGTVLSYQDVTLDLATHRTERAGARMDLTAKEQALLVYFLRHPREVLTRTRIYEAVWDERYDGLSNTLEVHVMELRRKLEAHGPRLIHTLRGRGYFFGDKGEEGR